MVVFDWLVNFFKGTTEAPTPTATPTLAPPRGLVRVWPYCRADKNTGRTIYCPNCGAPEVVSNFAWKEKSCHKCGTTTERNNWLTLKTKEEQTKKARVKLAVTKSRKKSK